MIVLDPPISGISEAALAGFARRAQKLARVSGEVSILIAGNRRIQELNRRFRKKNKPTDVLSFPRSPGGDIAISAAIAAQNAARYGHMPAEEIKVLILHGMLHLAGYDHETDNGKMAAREAALRKQLKLPGSLIERAHTNKNRGPQPPSAVLDAFKVHHYTKTSVIPSGAPPHPSSKRRSMARSRGTPKPSHSPKLSQGIRTKLSRLSVKTGNVP